MLNYTRMGAADAPPLLIAHGLFGSARNWNVLATRLSDRFQVITVDMRNHGLSPWMPSHSYHDLAADLAEVIGECGGKAHVLGHSMGGKAAMVLALEHGDLVDRLIIADIAPKAYGHTQLPLLKAMRNLDLQGLSTRREADQRLGAEVPEPSIRAFLLQSLDMKSTPPAWRLNLDVLATEMPKIMGFPGFKSPFSGPNLFLSGGRSTYVQGSDHDDIASLFPQVNYHTIADAGHWLHAEQPREFEASVRQFLAT